MRQPFSLRWSALVAASLLVPLTASAAGGSSGGVPEGSGTSSREQRALLQYKEAERARDKAHKYEESAGATNSATERAKLLARSRKQYERAADRYRRAIRIDDDFYFAHGGLGYVLRRLDDYEGALEAYDRALAIEPRYGEAVEYRAEAYLALGRYSEVREAYATLEAVPELEAQLRHALGTWLSARRAEQEQVASDRADLPEEHRDEHRDEAADFAAWVESLNAPGAPAPRW